MKIRKHMQFIKRAIKYPGGLKHKAAYYRFAKLAHKNGVIDFRIDRIAKEYTHDYLEYDGETKEDKNWGYSKGLPSYKFKWYGVTRDNYENYISDFDFYNKENYINMEFSSWFEHKLNTYFLLQPFKKNMPRHYWFVNEKREILPIDVEQQKHGNVKDIVKLVMERPIAAKAVIGGHGIGFYKLDYKNGQFIVNNQEKSREEFTQIVQNLSNYIITDYVKPRQEYVDLCGEDTFAVIRMVMVYDKEDGPQLTGSLIRLGCKAGGIVTDYEGTIYCGLTLDEGKIFKPLYRQNDDIYPPCPNHPDTGKSLEGFVIPDWEDVVQLSKEVSSYIPMTPYLVMDIVPTEDGFSILEINSHGQLRIIEPYYPFLKNPYNRKVFKIRKY